MALDVATTTYTLTELVPLFANDYCPLMMNVKIKPSVTLAQGTVLGLVTASGHYGAYNDGGSGGLEVAKCILPRAVATDSSGNITYGTASGGGQLGETHLQTPVYFTGIFNSADLTGLDAAGAADLGRFLVGDSTTGILHVR